MLKQLKWFHSECAKPFYKLSTETILYKKFKKKKERRSRGEICGCPPITGSTRDDVWMQCKLACYKFFFEVLVHKKLHYIAHTSQSEPYR